MVKMTVKIDLIEDEEGRVKSRVATAVDTPTVPSFAILDHMLRKVDTLITQARTELTEQCKLQNIVPKPEAPF